MKGIRRSSFLPHLKQTDPNFDDHLLSPVLPAMSSVVSRNPNVLHLSFPDYESQKATLNGLIDAIENRLTLQYSDGTFYRITFPSLAYSSLVENCLVCLRQVLRKEVAIMLLCRWYATRNVMKRNSQTEISKDIPATPSSATKRQKQFSIGSDDDWNYILNSEHRVINENLSCMIKLDNNSQIINVEEKQNIAVNLKSVLFPYIRLIHYSLHLLYEDLKLNTLRSEDLLPLMKFLNKLSADLNLIHYNLHYWKDFPQYGTFSRGSSISQTDLKNVILWPSISDKPVDVMQHIYCLLQGSTIPPYNYLANVNERSRDIIQLCGVLSEANRSTQFEIPLDSFVKELNNCNTQAHHKTIIIDGSAIEQVVLLMVEMKITTRYLDTLPVGIYFLFYNALWKCRENPPSDWPADAYYLLWREDLAAQALKMEKEKQESSQELLGMYSSTQLQDVMPGIKADSEQIDGMEDIENSLTKLRFNKDVRVNEARKMLQSSKPVPIVLTQRPDVSDHDFIEEQEKHLYGICIRTMALPVGRGMFTLRTATPVITEPSSCAPPSASRARHHLEVRPWT
ncbi:hypothetical protein NQ318_004566 [Aromia moschata]|uniref:Anaphase-promoting complex subunit 1 middle domain-containing protein n=1 Tax=Aromia moschata TaxID=1265417 RepID=A0AAV8Y8J8_9CUCU|nr:hypothetical protein NQ318_004566 [Aromia moschata]